MLDYLIENLNSANIEATRLRLIMLSCDLQECNEIQTTSCKLLNFFVKDLLSLSQINEGKFRKDLSNFDIRVAINEIMSIQKMKADLLRIKFTSKFVGFSSHLICTDMSRLQ